MILLVLNRNWQALERISLVYLREVLDYGYLVIPL